MEIALNEARKMLADLEQGRTLDSLASSTDAAVVPISVAALGDPGSGSENYVAMMRQLGETIREALS